MAAYDLTVFASEGSKLEALVRKRYCCCMSSGTDAWKVTGQKYQKAPTGLETVVLNVNGTSPCEDLVC